MITKVVCTMEIWSHIHDVPMYNSGMDESCWETPPIDARNSPERLPDFDPAFFERLLDSLHDGVYFVDCNRKILYWNKGAELLTGYSAAEVVGRSCFDNILSHVNDNGCMLCTNGCPLQQTIADGVRRESEVYLRHKLGHRVPVSVRVAPITDKHGVIIGAVEIFTDVSAKKHFEKRLGELENLVYLDTLTCVPNRRYIELKVRQALQEVEQFDRKIGLLMVDVDHFKQINDDHGHTSGDATLKAVSDNISRSLRAGDVLGRWGGEEFLIIVSGMNQSNLRSFAERCRMLVSESPIQLPGNNIRITISVGATLMQRDDTDQTVIKRADELMYQSKLKGRNQVTIG
jgi:diguanylate cyclase (GGDEF)-like protein/PAS domain S-box-containing protein